MIKLVVTLVFRLSLQFIFWLFIFSIKVSEKTVHTHALNYVNKNKLVQNIGDKAEKVWYSIKDFLSQNVGDGSSSHGHEMSEMDMAPYSKEG